MVSLNQFLLDLCLAAWGYLQALKAKAAFLVCSFLCSAPKPPSVSIHDVRANRIRLNIQPQSSSMFNKRVEQHEIEWAGPATEGWVSAGANNFPQRTVARLQPRTDYRFRVRAVNPKGVSSWTPELQARTKMDPVKGGGNGPGFTWEQTLTDVTISIELPANTQKRNLQLDLRPTHIRAAVAQPEAEQPMVLLEGSLYGRVRSFESGSSWELVREKGKLMLVITLEKACKSVAPKFDYWRSVIPGQEEIDTHKLNREAEGLSMNMINPGDLDALQMRNMGVQGF